MSNPAAPTTCDVEDPGDLAVAVGERFAQT
jgi:hypothetical protein